MAANEARMLSTEDTLAMISEKAKKDGDEFIVKIQRRRAPGFTADLVATMSGAQHTHFVSPELWVPQLVGGGRILLAAYHASDQSKQVGGFVQVEIGAQGSAAQEPHDVDFAALKRSDWRGPAVIDYPLPQERRPQDDPGMYRIPGNSPPPAPGTGDSATASHPAWARSAGGGFPRLARPSYEDDATDRALRDRGAVEAERRKVEEERLQNERERHAAQLEAIKKEHAADLRAMEMRLMTTFQQNKAPPDNSVSEFLKMFIQQQAEDKRAAEAQRQEDRRAAEARTAADNARFERLIEKMSEKKPEKDPIEQIKVIADLVKPKDDSNNPKMMHQMMEMMSTITGASMDFVERAADMQLGAREAENPIVKGIEHGVKAITAMARGSAAKKQLPAQQPQAQAPRQPQQASNETALTVLQQIEIAVKEKLQPPTEVARVLIANREDPEIYALVASVGFDFEAAFDKRLGNWKNVSPDNMAYFKSLIAEIEKAAQAAGLFDGPDEPEDAQTVEEDQPEGDEEAP